jgi:hypothetical protein
MYGPITLFFNMCAYLLKYISYPILFDHLSESKVNYPLLSEAEKLNTKMFPPLFF